MNDTVKTHEESTAAYLGKDARYSLHIATCKLSAIRCIDPDEMKQGDFYGVRFVIDEVLNELSLIEDYLNEQD